MASRVACGGVVVYLVLRRYETIHVRIHLRASINTARNRHAIHRLTHEWDNCAR